MPDALRQLAIGADCTTQSLRRLRQVTADVLLVKQIEARVRKPQANRLTAVTIFTGPRC
jgi:hypothetical protein